jgi:crotonobetainyl-CoA:carnitine CoA-transferase CaiB-like acyl-CoA transferase
VADDVAGALDQITVLDLSSGTAGALDSMFLCDDGARLQSAGVPSAPVVETDDAFFRDSHAIAARKMVVHDHPVPGRMRHSDGLLDFGDTRAVAGRPAPLLGQHTEEVLVEAGYSHEEVADMVRAGAVALDEPQAG